MVKHFGFLLNGNKEVYRAGELVSGECVLELTETLTAKAVRVYLHGEAFVKWEDVEIEAGHVGHYVVPKPKTIERTSREHYFSYVCTLWGIKVNQTGQASQLPPGTHRWKFSLQIPKRPLPSSYEGEYGAIRYWLKSEIHKPFPWPNVKRYRCITVLDDLNLNALDYQKQVRGSNQKTVSKMLGFGNAGRIQLSANTDKKGYCSGESIGICATMVNESTKNMDGSKAKLIQRAHYYAAGKEKTTENVICIIEGAKIPKGVTMKWQWELMDIGCLPPSSRSGSCNILKVSYYIKMFIQVPLGFDLHVHLPIVIGTIPYRHRAGNLTPTAAQASLAIAQYAKCNRGIFVFSESTSGFPSLGYTSMSAYVPNYVFVPPEQRPKPTPTAPKSASAAVKKTSSLPAVLSYCVVIRFPKDQLPVFQSTLMANKSTVEDYGGVLISVTDNISTTVGFPWSESHAMALLVFPNKDKAVDWVKTTPEVSETGWLGGADITVFLMREINKPEIKQGFYSIELTKCPRAITKEDISKLGRIYTKQLRAARGLHGASLLISAGSKTYENVRGKLVSSPHVFTCCQWSSAGSYEKFLYLLQTGEYRVAMDFWAELYRLETRVTMETIDMKWWLEETINDVSNTSVETVKAVQQEDEEMGVYMVIRFPFDKFSLFQDIVKQNKPLLRETHGGMVALAPQAMTTEGATWPVGKALAILKFKTSDDSKQWLEGVSHNEGLWLKDCETLILKKRESSHNDYGTFLMTTFTVNMQAARDDLLWLSKEFVPTTKPLRLKHGGAVLFNAGPSKNNCESIQGDWITGKQFLACVQWPNARSYFDYDKEWKSVTDENRAKKMVNKEQVVMLETLDLSWLNEDSEDDKDPTTEEDKEKESGLEEYKAPES